MNKVGTRARQSELSWKMLEYTEELKKVEVLDILHIRTGGTNNLVNRSTEVTIERDVYRHLLKFGIAGVKFHQAENKLKAIITGVNLR